MADDNEIQPIEDRRTVAARGYPAWVPALLLVLLAAAGAFAWYTYGQVAALGEELAAMTAERDQAAAEADRRQALVAQAESARSALEARQKELEGQLSEAREEAQRLQAAAAAAAVAAPPPAEPAPAAPAAATAAAAPPPGADPAAAAVPEPAAGPAVTVVEPAAKPAPVPVPPQTLTITFDVNSSYFPDSLNGRLRSLASQLKPGQAYAVELTGSIGNDPVANGAPGDAASYNRWIAERRVDRVADFLRANAKAGDLAIKRAYARNDPSRRVVVKIRPLVP